MCTGPCFAQDQIPISLLLRKIAKMNVVLNYIRLNELHPETNCLVLRTLFSPNGLIFLYNTGNHKLCLCDLVWTCLFIVLSWNILWQSGNIFKMVVCWNTRSKKITNEVHVTICRNTQTSHTVIKLSVLCWASCCPWWLHNTAKSEGKYCH